MFTNRVLIRLGVTAGVAVVAFASGCANRPMIHYMSEDEEVRRFGALAPMHFMEGTWRSREDNRLTEEHWSAAIGDSMIGYSRTIDIQAGETAGARLMTFESLRLTARTAKGSTIDDSDVLRERATAPDAAAPSADAETLVIEYLARPRTSGQWIPFRLQESSWQRAVFTNPAHDYPKRITYWIDVDGRLHAKIDDLSDDPAKANEWVFEKVGQGR